MRTLLAVSILVLALAPRSSAQRAHTCPVATIDSTVRQKLRESLFAFQRRQEPGLQSISLVSFEQVSVRALAGCQTFVAANDGGIHFGILALFDSAGRLAESWPIYPEAQALSLAGRNRIALRYLVWTASGEHEWDLQILCNFASGYWVPCYSVPIDLAHWVAPRGVRGELPSLAWGERARYQIRSDTIHLVVTGSWQLRDSRGATIKTGSYQTRRLAVPLP